jgi:hypothetical protein
LTPPHTPANTLHPLATTITYSDILAAGQQTGGGTGTLVLLAVLAGAGYLIACWIWPFRACRRCQGAGRFRSPSGRAWRHCRKCGGRGAQLRTGRRIWIWINHTRNGDH